MGALRQAQGRLRQLEEAADKRHPIVYRAIGHVENDFDEPTAPHVIRAVESRIVLDPALAEGLRGLEPGRQVQIKAVIVDSATNLMLAGLEDTTRKVGEPLKLPDGSEYQRYESLDPVIKVANAAGETVAEGKMPFG